ncbi:hypothetical protein [Arthrobacter sp. PsM3]|nr:hypothetical protein [Arthrobacter sp. PsM3]MDN4642458.1 hypothetical protein [Arthrobacter sp. PsM3]
MSDELVLRRLDAASAVAGLNDGIVHPDSDAAPELAEPAYHWAELQ